jgi:hypothetical protein
VGVFQNHLMAAAVDAAAAGGAFEIEYAISMDDSDNDYVTWSPDADGNRQKWTWSQWFKRKETNSEKYLWAGGTSGSQYYVIGHRVTNQLLIELSGDMHFRSTSTSYGSTSTWMHWVIAVDSTQSTEADRVKIYIDGTRITAWDTENYPSEDHEITWINTTNAQQYADTTWTTGANYYMADINFVDGLQLAPTEFGETSGADWIPIDPDVTYGTNGYRLEFKETGTGQDASGIGADTSGENNHFATVNLTSSNRITDTPTNPS